MVNSKNSLNLKKDRNTFIKSISSRHQVDSLIKKENNHIKTEKLSIKKQESLKIENINKNKVDNSSIDDSKRMFLKVAGVAGLGLAASALFPKSSEAYVSGSTPTSNVVGLKDSTNTRVNPATEDTLSSVAKEVTLAEIKNKSDKLTFDGSNNLLTKGVVTVSNVANTPINPATEEGLANVGQSVNDQSIWMLRKILTLMKPLGVTTGNGSNRLSIDINTGNIVISSGTVTTVSTVSTVNNLASIGGVGSFTFIKDTSRNAYANSIRTKISF